MILRHGRRIQELPLASDGSSRFLPWIVGLMVYLAALALAVTMLVSSVGMNWRSDLLGTVTVQIMPLADDVGTESLEARTGRALALLKAAPGVARAELLSGARVSALLEPWLGPGATSVEFPLPRLIDVALVDSAVVDTGALAERLATAVPGAALDDHGRWMGRLLGFVRGLEAVALTVLALICGAAISTVIFTTRTGLAIHQGAIEVMHLIGAEDGYIAGQFQAQVQRLALKGGLAGFALATVTLVALGQLAPGGESGLLPDISLSVLQWLALALIPIATIAISVASARWTVLRAIAGMR